MFDYYGWAFVGWDLVVKEKLQKYIDQLFGNEEELTRPVQIQVNNGIVQMVTTGCRNRKGTEGEAILSVYEYLGTISYDAYGLLYIQNDWELENEFQVYVLKRGKLEERRDPFLSPLVPVVEDPWDPGSEEDDD